MTIRAVIIIILSFCYSTLKSQSEIDSTFIGLRYYDLENAQRFANTIKHPQLKALFNAQITYCKKGVLPLLSQNDTLLFKIPPKTEVTFKILKADYMSLNKAIDVDKNDAISKTYFSALHLAKQIKDTFLISETLLKLNLHLLYRCRDSVGTKSFLKAYKAYKDRSLLDKHWYNYINTAYVAMNNEQRFDVKTISTLERLFKDAYTNPILEQHPILKAKLHQSYGIFLSHWVKDYKKANLYNTKALEIYKSIPHWFSQKGIKGLAYNTHINLYKHGDYKKAIVFFKKDLKRDKEPLYIMYTYKWLYKCYEGLHKTDSALYYLKRMHEVKDALDQKAHSRAILEIEAAYNYNETSKALKQKTQQAKHLETRLLTILPIFGIVSLLLIVSYYLYRRYKAKTTVLEEEQSETLQKLDELKDVVIKNHIILKDKTKVYVSDLVYIKSEDHYLNVYTSNGKSHLVRGKLSSIQNELPPNFIRCHRSYIVNANFIKQVHPTKLELIDKSQIPLSRSYKDKF